MAGGRIHIGIRLALPALVGLDAYCYFDNDEAGYAFKDAVRLARMVRDRA